MNLISIAVFLVLCVPFFSVFIPAVNYAVFLVTALLIISCALQCAKQSVRVFFPLPFIALGLFYVFVLLNDGADAIASEARWFVMFGGLLVSMILIVGEHKSKWERLALILCALFGLFYSLATIIFWLAPQLYDSVYPYLLSRTSSAITGEGYRAGLTVHYSTNGIYIALGFLSSAALALRGKDGKWTLAAIITLFALVLTTKRAHLAFSVVAFSLVYFLYNSSKPFGAFAKFLVLISVALLGIYIVSFFNDDVLAVIERFSEVSDDDSFGGRSNFYKLCISMFLEHPLLGNGWNSYTEAFNRTYEGAVYIASGHATMNAHNVYLQVLAEEGLVGMVLFLGGLYGGIVTTAKRLLDAGKSPLVGESDFDRRRCILAGSLAIQLFFAMYCITGNPLYDMQMYVPWLLSLGMAYCAMPKELLKAEAGRWQPTGHLMRGDSHGTGAL